MINRFRPLFLHELMINLLIIVFLEVESDSDLVSPEGKDTIEAHVDIIKERYEQIHKMKVEQRIRNNIEADNPFQPEGEVSKDANEIVDAIQSGNLQNIYTSPSGTLKR